MNESEEVLCPYCGQSMELLIDTTVRNQRFTTDCEVCCRPFEVIAECDDGEVVSLDTQA
ncbi:MAG: CPXCG motif-containing cysteine-rich protein [Verrucomicrobia bacterium]|nr:CPXCG motif-containing cysteine-rich protein [Verrucomicrobiota bacterium]